MILIGSDINSWGYHSDDGNIFCCPEYGELYGLVFTTDDTIGCCLNFTNDTVFYTKNGVHLGFYNIFQRIALRDLKGVLYPCVGLKSQGGAVEANFGHKKFKYAGNIYYHLMFFNIFYIFVLIILFYE